jgi:hypothetical protein
MYALTWLFPLNLLPSDCESWQRAVLETGGTRSRPLLWSVSAEEGEWPSRSFRWGRARRGTDDDHELSAHLPKRRTRYADRPCSFERRATGRSAPPKVRSTEIDGDILLFSSLIIIYAGSTFQYMSARMVSVTTSARRRSIGHAHEQSRITGIRLTSFHSFFYFIIFSSLCVLFSLLYIYLTNNCLTRV